MRHTERRLYKELLKVIDANNVKLDNKILEKVVEEMAQQNFRGMVMAEKVGAALAQYLKEIGEDTWFIREIARAVDVTTKRLIKALKKANVKYVPNYEKRVEEEFGEEGLRLYRKIKELFPMRDPVVIFATVEFLLGDVTKTELSIKYDVSDVAIRSLVKELEKKGFEIRR